MQKFFNVFMRCVMLGYLAGDACIAGAGTPEPAPAGKTPNVVFIVVDDLRADVMSIYGGAVGMPNLEGLAKKGCVFERATCGYPICHVSRTEMLTGRYLVAEGAARKPISFHDDWAVWPKFLQLAGYETVYCGKWHVQGDPWSLGYDRTEALYSSGGARGLPLTHERSATGRDVTGYTGWTFKSNENQPMLHLGIGLTPDTDRHIADGAIRAIDRSNGPFFLHVNFTAPHDPLHWPSGLENSVTATDVHLPANFTPVHPFDHGNQGGRDETIVPAPRSQLDVQRERAVYYALTRNLDRQLGRIVDALRQKNLMDQTVIIFTSDHGLALGSHGLMGKQNQYEHTCGVPLVIAGPSVVQGRRLVGQCGLRDLFPSVCEWLQMKCPESVQGKSLLPMLLDQQPEVHEAIFGYFTDTQRMIRSQDGWKLIWYPQIDRMQLFDLNTDPEEQQDLSQVSDYAHRLSSMRKTLKTWLIEQGDPVAGSR